MGDYGGSPHWGKGSWWVGGWQRGGAVVWQVQRADRVQGRAHSIVSSLFSKSDFTNRMYLGVSRRSGRSQDGIRAVWLLKSPSMAILPWVFLHSVSEIDDFLQRLKTILCALPCTRSALCTRQTAAPPRCHPPTHQFPLPQGCAIPANISHLLLHLEMLRVKSLSIYKVFRPVNIVVPSLMDILKSRENE